MPKIRRFPVFGKRFFRLARKLVGSCHFSHFFRAVITLAAANGRRTLSKIEEASDAHRSRQSIAFFLTQAHWDAPQLLQETALATLKQLGWKLGESVYIVLDDTQKRKRAKRMDAVSKIFLHAEKVYSQGHTIVCCVLIYRGVVIPYAVRLWASESFCEKTRKLSYPSQTVEFCKLTQLAANMIHTVSLPKSIVLFDSYYLCPTVVKACDEQGYRYVSVAKKNRNFYPDGRPHDKRKISTYGKNALHCDGRVQKVRDKKYRLTERVGDLSKAGRVKLVFSRRVRESKWIAMVTNETRWSVKTILSHYLFRWSIEVLFKETKQYLGLGDYQILRYRGVERYLQLVMIAHLLLTHLAINEAGAQAKQKKQKLLSLPSVSQMQVVLRNKLLDDALDNMEKKSKNQKIYKKLKELIMF
jgi:SRSO17 transposase